MNAPEESLPLMSGIINGRELVGGVERAVPVSDGSGVSCGYGHGPVLGSDEPCACIRYARAMGKKYKTMPRTRTIE